MAANMVNSSRQLSFDLDGAGGQTSQLFSSGGSVDTSSGNGTVVVSLDALGSLAYALE